MKRPAKKHARFVTPIPESLGPYETWLFGAGMDYGPASVGMYSRRYLTAISEVEPSIEFSFIHQLAARHSRRFRIPTLWKRNEGGNDQYGLRHIPFVIGRPKYKANIAERAEALDRRLREGVSPAKAERHLKSGGAFCGRFRVGLPVGTEAMKDTLEKPTAPSWRPDGELRARIGQEKRITVVAVIDDGLPFAHRNFRDATGSRTRVEFCWLQSAKAACDQTSVLFGREFTRRDIDAWISKSGGDEDELYRRAGATDDTEGLASLLSRHATHGAHVMDLATGYAPERQETAAEGIRIIGVQLPNLLTIDTSGIGKDMYVLSALHYIFDRADLIAEGYGQDRLRLVINFSYGYFGGPHDGIFDIEGAITDLVRARRSQGKPTAVVLPTGNSFLDRLHVSVPDDRFVRRSVVIPWRLQPNDRTPNYLEIWFPKQFKPLGYTVSVTDPSGVEFRALRVGLARGDENRVVALYDQHRRQVGQMSVDERNGRWRVLIVTAPSEPHPGKLPAARAGLWQITISREPRAARLEWPIHCWIQRDTDPISVRSGARQSYFDDPGNIQFDERGALMERDTPTALVRRFGSLNGLATSEIALAVAGFRRSSAAEEKGMVPSRYSCAGTQDLGRVSCSSLSDRTAALPGTVAAGVRSGSRSILQGTSVAAPLVARRLAEAFLTASNKRVERAEADNYVSLLPGPRLTENDDQLVRLGKVAMPPHGQVATS
ncbi:MULTISPECIES: hypothetical protein [unclassified Bradyrhizobium]|uniref:hypothetical protein n=1 Tax=unclassified Bradyrhizobium TaxID=2631580 RepID=UPI0028EE9070|nr:MULTISPECIES: hypothetical protein [unclassified Bradyrhizobium]